MKIIFEDKDLLVFDKPAGILTHPTPAGENDTVVDFLKKHISGIEKLAWPDPTRPGIVHRLDKDTSGLIVIAKSPEILSRMQEQFKKRKVKKVYTALVLGKTPKQGNIETNITRGKAGEQKAQVLDYSTSKNLLRPALTLYETSAQYKFENNILSLLKVFPKTGRMHQIRVQLKYIGHPVIGDQLYNTKLSRQIAKKLNLNRQFLHATKLEFRHPLKREIIHFRSDLPCDLKDILEQIERGPTVVSPQ